jgi:hypothetical protein
MGAIAYDEPYFGDDATRYENVGTYADDDARFEARVEYEFQHTLGEIVTALVNAGLRIDFLHEFPFAAWKATPDLVKGEDGYYRPPAGGGKLAHLFSIKAIKPA